MKNNLKNNNLLCALIIFLILPISIGELEFELINGMAAQGNGNDLINSYFINEINDTNSSVKPLPGKEYVELYQADFTQDSSDNLIDAIIVFNDNIIWNFPDLTIDYQYKYLNGFKATIPETMFDYLEEKPFIKHLYEKSIIRGTMDFDILDWGVDRTDAEVVWGGSENARDVIAGYPAGEGVKVALMDTGIDYDHTDLNTTYCGGYDFGDEDNNPMDEEDPYGGHGTFLAGIIGAKDNINDVIGVAPEVDLYALKVWGKEWNPSTESYDYFLNDIDEAMEWAIENEMDIINIAFSLDSENQAFHDICDIAYTEGITIIGSAGNDGLNTTHYPSTYSSVIQIGSLNYFNTLTSSSNYGPDQEFVAHGGTPIAIGLIRSDDLGGGTSQAYGTSIAAAMVSGVCALLHNVTPNLMPEEIRYILKNSSVDRGTSGFDQTYGWGQVNADAAIDVANGTDSDSDGIIDVLETYVWETDPDDNDSDDDGLNDRLEVRIYHSDPFDADTDKDSLNDYAEAITYETDPTDEDSDNDGYHDQIEILLDYDPNDYSHHPQQSFLFENGNGDDHVWTATDSTYNTVTENHTKDDYDTIRDIETTSHVGNGQYATCAALDLSDWDGINNLHITLRYRCTSTYSGSSVTQFRIKFYDDDISDYITFDNPTDYTTYYVKQNNRNGQTWISGTDSGWQNETFTLLSSDFEDFNGTGDQLFIHWGHHDSWAAKYTQTEYLDYLMISEEDNAITPDEPRSLTGLGDGISEIALFWKSPLNILADEYKIYRKVSGVYTLQATVSHGEGDGIEDLQYWTDDSLSTGVTYYYRVCAVNGEIEGAYSYWSGQV